jgi:BASS family bile acid:Na+ symporter
MNSSSTVILAIALFIIMLGMGLSLVKSDFTRILKHPKAIILGLVNQILVLPLIAYLLLNIYPTSPEIAIGVMILAACPGGPTSNLIAHLAKGDTALSVSLTAMSSLLTILTIPVIVNFALTHFLEVGQIIQLPIATTIAQIFAIVIIPISLGMTIKMKRPEFASKMSKPVRSASAVVLIMVILGIILKEKAHIIPYFKQAGLITLALNIFTMAFGYFSAKLLKLAPKQAVSLSIESGIQNGTMAIMIATVLLSNTAFAVAPAIYSLIMFGTGGLMIVFFGKRAKTM